MPARRPIGSPALILILLATALPVRSQIPDEFTNLQLLDPQIDQAELVSIMRAFALDLGVRCNHCHVGPENLQGMDFASDELATKRTAREMIKMVRAIERGHLAALPVVVEGDRREAIEVSCYTCHRGAPTPPRPTTDLLDEAIATEGTEVAVEKFADLREMHSEAGRYDLRPVVLFRVARGAMEAGQHESALILLDSLHELAPAMGDAYALRAQVEIARNQLDAAQAAWEKARQVDPEARLADWVEGLLVEAREN